MESLPLAGIPAVPGIPSEENLAEKNPVAVEKCSVVESLAEDILVAEIVEENFAGKNRLGGGLLEIPQRDLPEFVVEFQKGPTIAFL